MLTSNLWVEAGLINGAQGKVEDIVFHPQDSTDSLPTYVLVSLDEYNGPPLFQDDEKKKWVPIFQITRQHQYQRNIERTQIPLRLSHAMTGHKVQGLSLYNGVIVHYPTKEESKRSPMATWGLNYCMLTRVPDLSKIAFINLPDFETHRKLYEPKSKSTTKDHFRLFLRFDQKAHTEFANFVCVYAKTNLNDLKNAKEKLNLLPINFYSVFQEETQNFQQAHLPALQKKPSHVEVPITATASHRFKERNITKQSYHFSALQQLSSHSEGTRQVEQNTVAVSTFSRFENPYNYCWFNSVLQVIIHVLNNNAQILNMDLPQENDITSILFNKIKEFAKPGIYNVGKNIEDPAVAQHYKIPLTHLMLKAMDINHPEELNKQQDALDCIQFLIANIPHLEILFHHIQEEYHCNGCDIISNAPVLSMPVALIPVVTKREKRSSLETFSATDAITGYFQNPEQIDKHCECGASTCSKQITLQNRSNYIVIQFKRYSRKRTRNSEISKKITAKSDFFSDLDIKTSEGVQKYKVIATIEHQGPELRSGHYISYILNNDTWYCCNDEAITILPTNSKAPTENIYILLLKKVE